MAAVRSDRWKGCESNANRAPVIGEGTYRLADLVIKAASGIGVVVGGVWAVYQYLGGVEIGFRKPLWERQLDLYFQACEASSILANYPESSPEWTDAEKKFWTLYWGPLVVVKDAEHVSQAMIRFGAALNTSPRKPEVLRECSFNLVRVAAVRLPAHGESNWHRSLPAIRADWARKRKRRMRFRIIPRSHSTAHKARRPDSSRVHDKLLLSSPSSAGKDRLADFYPLGWKS